MNRGNHFRGLTLEQVEQIYRSKIQKWSAVGGREQSITRLGTKYPLLSWAMFTKEILHGKAVRFPDEFKYDPNNLPQVDELNRFHKEQQSRFPGGGPYACYQSDAKLIEAVAEKSNAIGYCLLFPSSGCMNTVRMLPIARKNDEKAEPPMSGGVLSDAYPLQKTIWLLVHPDAPESTKAFVKHVCSPVSSDIIKQCGLWPEYELQQYLGKVRLKEMQAGKGVAVAAGGIGDAAIVMKALAVEYVKARATVQLAYRTVSTAKGFGREDDKTEMLLWDQPLPESGAAEPEAAPEIVSKKLGSRAVAVVVHPDNGIALRKRAIP